MAFIPNPYNKKCVDHINGDITNNYLENLRWATNSENMWNKRISKKNKCGIKGVMYDKTTKKWRAYININKKHISLGSYNSMEEAKEARENKARSIFKEFCNE